MADLTFTPIDTPAPRSGAVTFTPIDEPKPSGPPVSGMSAFFHGLGNPFVGVGQAASHIGMVPQPEFDRFSPVAVAMGQPAAAETPTVTAAQIDKSVAAREAAYQARRQSAGQTGIDLPAAAGEFVGSTLLTAPLAAVGGPITGFVSGVARGMGLGAAAGAIGGAAEPVTSGDFGREKARQIIEGAGVGAATGGVLGGLAGAIARNDPAAAAKAIRDSYYRGIRPGTTMTAPQRSVYDTQVRDAVDAIIELRGKNTPRSPEQFSQAIAEAKSATYDSYSGMAKEAEAKGARVPLQDAADRLSKLANDTLQDPAATAEAKRLLAMVPGRNATITPTRAEEIMTFLNERATGFDTQGTKGGGAVFREAASALRQSLVSAVEGAGFKDYGKLRQTYGSLRSIEDDVGRATGRELAKGGPGFGLSDIGAAGLVGAGEPVSAATVEGGKFFSRWLKSPNRAITRLFDEAASIRSNTMPPGLQDLRGRIRGMIEGATLAAAGGAGGAAAGP